MTRFLALWGPVIAIGAAVATLSHMSSPPRPSSLPDWLLHGAEYAVLGFFLARALSRGTAGRVTLSVAVATLALGAGYGATDEMHQAFVPYRDASFRDLAADSGGTLIGLGMMAGLSRLLRDRRGQPAAPVDVTLITGPGCPLCLEAREMLQRLGARLPLRVEERSVEEDAALAVRHGREVPVIQVAGKTIARGKVNEQRLAASLAARGGGRA